ncbi:MAG: cbb3-type cytochrome c oxidase subunit 3 [Devosia sp.]|nr:cbb3-type cytochrome c oxidase subunit 3 [Devosia sp.]
MLYDSLRHFADSWGLVYLFGIFISVALFLLRPNARARAVDAANIPFRDDQDPIK